jgi:hypothetical protein
VSDCLTDDTLALLVDKRLSAHELRTVHEHVDGCDACRLLLAEAVKGLPAEPAAESPPEPPPAIELALQTAREVVEKYSYIGPYRLQRMIGEGGMGVVFAAVHTSIGRRVAIKVLHRRLSMDPEFRARFFNEARAVNIIEHPGIVGVFEFGELPDDGGLYLVMEHLEGKPLRNRWPISKDPAERAIDLGLLRQVASALQAVHAKGIVHRDPKSSNDSDGEISSRSAGGKAAEGVSQRWDFCRSATVVSSAWSCSGRSRVRMWVTASRSGAAGRGEARAPATRSTRAASRASSAM